MTRLRSEPRRDGERGAILPLFLGMLLILVVFFFGAITLGRFVVARGEAQRAADATCLAFSNIVKNEGLQVLSEQHQRAEVVGRANTRLPLTFDWSVPPAETATSIELTCKATARVPAPSFIWASASLNATGTAKTVAPQQTITQAEKSYPQVVLVLDYSGSMQRTFTGAWTTPHDDDSFNTLVRAAQMLLAKDYVLRYGMVIFSSGPLLYRTDGLSLDNGPIMKDKVDDPYRCPYNSNNCNTDSRQALADAYRQLSDQGLPPKEKKYVIFVSDGEPTAGGSGSTSDAEAARQQARKLWDLGTSIFTLHVINSPSSQTTLKQFMISISGPPDHRGVETVGPMRYYYNASDDASMEAFFDALGGALACGVQLSDPAPADDSRMHVFVRDGARDVQLANAARATNVDPGQDGVVPADQVGDLWSKNEPFAAGDALWFFYSASEKVIFVTEKVCERIQKQGQPVIVRFSSGQLSL